MIGIGIIEMTVFGQQWSDTGDRNGAAKVSISGLAVRKLSFVVAECQKRALTRFTNCKLVTTDAIGVRYIYREKIKC